MLLWRKRTSPLIEAVATDFFFPAAPWWWRQRHSNGDRAFNTSHGKWGAPLKQPMRMKVSFFGGGTEETPPSFRSGLSRPLGYRSVSLQCNRQVCGEETSSALTFFENVHLVLVCVSHQRSPRQSTKEGVLLPPHGGCQKRHIIMDIPCVSGPGFVRVKQTHSQTV